MDRIFLNHIYKGLILIPYREFMQLCKKTPRPQAGKWGKIKTDNKHRKYNKQAQNVQLLITK